MSKVSVNGVPGRWQKDMMGGEYFIPDPTPRRTKMIITERRCEMCRWKNNEADGSLTCRNGPPTAQTIVVINRGRPQTLGVVGSWPPVNVNEWCGKFERGILQ